MSSTYLYSVNKVLNIDNSVNSPNTAKANGKLNQPSKCIVIGTNNLEVENNYNDKEGIDSQVRILGGTWTDELIVQNIFCHPSGGTGGGGFRADSSPSEGKRRSRRGPGGKPQGTDQCRPGVRNRR